MNKTAALFLSATLVTALMMTNSIIPAAAAETIGNSQLLRDTDGDGLTDYTELEISNSNLQDTDHDGILDGDEDIDQDGLTNMEEQKLGTNLGIADTDGDGIKDGAEVNKHETNPLNSDADGDHLDDGTEIELKLDPFNPDVDGDGIPDGHVVRTFVFPSNEFNLTGTMSGTSDVPKRVIIRKSPNLLVQKLSSAKTFDIVSMDPNLMYNLTIPYPSDAEKDDLEVFRYDKENAQLIPIDKQKLDKSTSTIQAEFQGGGSFVVLPKEVWKKSLRPVHAKKEKFKKFKGKAKVHGLPTFELNGDVISENGEFEIIQTAPVADTAISMDPVADPNAKKELTYRSKYKIQDMHTTPEGVTYVTAAAITTESGKTPTILIHGLTGGPGTWGFNTLWDNTSTYPSAKSNVQTYQTFTNTYYPINATSNYRNIDVNYVTGAADSTEMGPKLISNYGYTVNDDLYIFTYEGHMNDDAVIDGAYHLQGFMANLKAKKTWIYKFNLLGHSMGGLVSRYLIENIGTTNVYRLVTLGTPQFGGDGAVFGDLDREGSQLWNMGPYTSTILKNNATIPYIGFGGWEASYSTFVYNGKDIRGLYATSLGVPHTNTYGTYISNWNAYCRDSYRRQLGITAPSDVEDTWVKIDSALGSDYGPGVNYGMAPVKMNKRFLIWDDVYGNHSTMRKHASVISYTANSLNGLYDSEAKD